MRGTNDDARREARFPSEDVAQAEDFLYHLHRGSDLLLENKVLEAKEELERALHRRPQDAKSQDLLAGVYFRLGVYPRAIEIWSQLVTAYPSDVALRVNLALAYIKTAMADEAYEHLQAALRLQPDHERAWGYLGLIQWRRDRVHEARDAFLRAGQTAMARRMEEILAESAKSQADAQVEAARNRAAADDAARAIADGPAQRPVIASRSLRVSQVPPPPTASAGEAPVETLVGLVAAQKPAREVDEAECAREGDGVVRVRAQNGFVLRSDVVSVVVCGSAPNLVHRRVGGADATTLLGGERPMHRYVAAVDAIVSPPPSQSLHVLHIDDAPVFVVESRLVGFSPGLEIECITLALDTETLALVRLSGRGELLLSCGSALRALSVVRGRDARVRPAALVGYSGALFAAVAAGVSALSVVLRGDGTVLVT